jgi:hypothetical protein
VRARYLAATLRSRAAIARHHDRQLSRLIAQRLPRFPYYRPHLHSGFAGLPVMDKAALMANFAACNLGGFSAEVIRQSLAEERDGADGFQFGQSTGTSGNRGLAALDQAEQKRARSGRRVDNMHVLARQPIDNAEAGAFQRLVTQSHHGANDLGRGVVAARQFAQLVVVNLKEVLVEIEPDLGIAPWPMKPRPARGSWPQMGGELPDRIRLTEHDACR